MSQISKVDKILEEIYLEMELEEIDELLEEAENIEVLSEGEASAVMGRMTRAQSLMLDKIAKAREAGNSDLVKTLMSKLSKMKAIAKNIAMSGTEKVARVAKGAAEKGSEYAGKAGKAASTAGKAVAKGAGQAKDVAMQHPEAAAAAVAVAAIAAGVVIYKKFFAQAARACKGKSGSDKANCVSSFKVRGLQAAKSKVSAAMSKCKTPKCKAKLQSKIQGFDAKISAMKGKVSESTMDKYIADYVSELKELRSKN